MSYKRSILIFLLIIAAAFAFWYSLQLRGLFYDAVGLLERYIAQNQAAGMAIFAGLGVLSAMLSPFSSAPLVPAAILIWGRTTTLLLLSAGWLLGAIITYYIGRSLLRTSLKNVIPFEKIEYYRQIIPRRAQFILVLLFRLSMPAEVPGYVLGLIRYDLWKYLLATAISEISFAAITVYASQALIENDPILFVSLVGLAILSMTAMFFLFRKYLKQDN